LEIRVHSGALDKSDYKNLCIFVVQDKLEFPEIEERARNIISGTITRQGFKGKKGKIIRIPLYEDILPDNIYLIGLGQEESIEKETFRSAAGELSRTLVSDRTDDVILILPEGYSDNADAVAEGMTLGCHFFDKYITSKEDNSFHLTRVSIANVREEDIEKGEKTAEAQNFARDLANEPGNVINPVTLAEKAEELSKELGVECEIWDEKKLKEEKMLAMWNVGKGSSIPPRFIHLTYKPACKAEKKVVIVGKGITFDSGGLNIKPGEHMRDMKGDKTGACDVLGILKGTVELALPVELHVIIGAAENMPGGNSYRPDDILRARNGKTIEVDNTDAEGRVVLSDCLSFASELDPDVIIDFATLTGACVIALGNYTAGLFSPSDRAAGDFLDAAKEAGERFWRLPVDDEKLRENIKSKVADVLNAGGRAGGAITAAMFLQEFVKEGIDWIHLDIAGVDSVKKPYSYYPVGSSGFGVRACLSYLSGGR
jgi:leucyl aminopeptidase